MSNPCLPESALALTGQIDGAKAAADGLIGDATSSVADLIKGQTDGIKGKLDLMVPEIEPPTANLQDQMTSMLGSANDPAAMVTKFAELKKQFGGALDLDSVLKGVGLDADKLNQLDAKLSSAISAGNDLKNKVSDGISDAVSGIGNKLGLPTGGEAGDKLKAIASGVDGAIAGLLGGANIGDAAGALSSVCKKIPNLDLDKAGNIIKKGLPVDLPDGNAAILEAVADVKDATAILPPVKKLEAALENTTLTITGTSDDRAAATTYWQKRTTKNHDEIKSKASDKQAVISKLKRSAIAPDQSLVDELASYKYWSIIDQMDADAQREQTFKAAGLTYNKAIADFPSISRSLLNDKVRVASIRSLLEAGLESEVKIDEET